VKNPVIISDTLFTSNAASLGGAIYNGDQEINIINSKFESNKAEYGAAFASLTNGQTIPFFFLILDR